MNAKKMIQLVNIPKHVIDTSMFSNILHDSVRDEYESNIAKYTGAKYAVAVSSCTDAIFLSLKSINKKVICSVPSLSTTRFLNAIIFSGNDYIITDNPSWVGGNYILYEGDFRIIDSAQEVGQNMFNDQCNNEDLLLLSNYPTKPIGALKGGVVLSNDKEKIEWIRQAAYFGEVFNKDSWRGKVNFVGWQMYMNSVEAYIANENLKVYAGKRAKLNKLKNKYWSQLNKEIITGNSYHLFRIRVKDNEDFMKYAFDKGVYTGIHYKPIHLNDVYNYGKKWYCPKSEIDGKTVISIPLNEALTEEEINYIIKIVNDY